MPTDVQTPFIGTPLVPLKIYPFIYIVGRFISGATPQLSNVEHKFPFFGTPLVSLKSKDSALPRGPPVRVLGVHVFYITCVIHAIMLDYSIVYYVILYTIL